jgi:DNA (cytosine-5)-methyltransferase 1
VRVLDLFSGIGGFSLGLKWAGMETVQFCEIDPWCRQVLAKHWPGVPCHDDIWTFRPSGRYDLVCGGFPCQPFSHAGKRRGTADDRDLWPEMRRVIEETRPRWVIGENVAGFVNMELDRSLSDLEALGYACQAFVIPACAVDAPHRRDRVWIVGNSDQHGEPVGPIDAEAFGLQGDVAPPHQPGLSERPSVRRMDRRKAGRYPRQDTAVFSQWNPEPAVDRVAHGGPT